MKDSRYFAERRRDIVLTLRRFFYEKGFLEVETPLIIQAPAPEMHIEPVRSEIGFLITSPELHMKMLIARGFGNIFQICRVFRKGEFGRVHLPGFTILEWYRTNADYTDLMKDCQELFSYIANCINCFKVSFRQSMLTPSEPWKIITVEEAFVKWAGWNPIKQWNRDRFYIDLVEKVEPHLGFPQPCILKNYPASESALARIKESNPEVCERFEVYWGGIELANGFSELTDPVEQRRRFEDVIRWRRLHGLPKLPMPEQFLEELERMPKTAGIALGVDRLVMIFSGADCIQDVVLFSEEFLPHGNT